MLWTLWTSTIREKGTPTTRLLMAYTGCQSLLRLNTITKRTNSRSLLANHFAGYNWHEMESLGSVDLKVEYFNNCILTQLDYYLPTYSVIRHITDKPLVTDEFRRIIRQRQYAWTHGQLENYKKLRNMVNCLSEQFRQNFYKNESMGYTTLTQVIGGIKQRNKLDRRRKLPQSPIR